MTIFKTSNISTKSDIGTTAFTYGNHSKPYALTRVSAQAGMIGGNDQTIGYSSFEKVTSISEGDYTASFTYNAEQQRARMDVTLRGTNILTRWYAGGSYMKETAGSVTKEYTYLGGDAYSAPVVAVKQEGTTTYYYLLRDLLGNITHQVNTSNSVVAEYSFDAWGRRRNPNDWSYNLAGQPELFADRGFTGHEYLKWFNLYNMNGRLYDPVVGRFLSADPYIQDAGHTQSYNRYSYCLNNPLKYTDPSGYLRRKSDADAWAETMNHRNDFFMLNSGNGGNGGGGSSVGDWFSAYTRATRDGYTGGAGAFLDEFDNQIYSPNYNGTLNFIYYTTSYEKYVEPGYSLSGITTKQIRHDITINVELGGSDITSISLYLADLMNTFLDEHATRNLKALAPDAKAYRKVTHSINKAMEANRFTKVITKSIGKKLFGAGLVVSAIDIYEDPSGSNIAWNIADGLVGWAAFAPGLQLPAAIYFTGRMASEIIEEY